jgi:predicted peptidase
MRFSTFDSIPALALAALVLSVFAGCATMQSGNGARTPGLALRSVHVGEADRKYSVYVPDMPMPASGWPLIIFLHGSGERGTDGFKSAAVGLFPAVLQNTQAWPAIIAFPQTAPGERWKDHDEIVMAVLKDIESTWKIDPTRRALTGLSLGGEGTWAIGSAHPDIWSALAPVCGIKAGDPAAIAKLPIWAFHGEKDDVVPPINTRDMIKAIQGAGGKPSATYYPEANHNSWDRAYHEADLPKFLLTPRMP